MSYQAVIRNSSNALVVSSPVGMRVSILQGSTSGTAVYVETHNTTTNANGLVSIQIGGGTMVSGTFTGINWSTGPFFVKTETDPSGGTNYTIVGTSELLSVPYALFAASGTPGPQGPAGPQGTPGLKGDKGDDGAVGPQGPIGLTGPQGLKGDKGNKGDTGAVGPQGLQGPIGLTGPQGLKGDKGDTGAVGPQGLQGPIGLTGPQGLKGDKGDTGAVGPQGPIGLTGPQGLKGDKGDTGAVGPQGPAGPAGLPSPGSTLGEILYWNGSAWVAIPPGTHSQTLSICQGIPTWGPCPPMQPTVTTNAVTSVQPTSAILGGSISSVGPVFTILSRGVCWSKSQNPTLADSIRTWTTSTNSFSINVTVLNDASTYYVRAYATTSAGTVYGNQVTFNTPSLPTVPTVTTNAVTNISGSSATLSGSHNQISSSVTILAKGICWSTTTNPTITDSVRSFTTTSLTFSSVANNFVALTTYYVRAFVTTSTGTTYGNQVTFTPSLFIGALYQGGRIAYILQPSDPGYDAAVPHGLIVTADSMPTRLPFGCTNVLFPANATSNAYGTGNNNTIALVNACSDTNSVPYKCLNLVQNGYSDWFLPSENELMKIYYNRTALGIPTGPGNLFWASTDSGSSLQAGFSRAIGFDSVIPFISWLPRIYLFQYRPCRYF